MARRDRKPEERPSGLTHNPFAALRPDGKPAEPTPEAATFDSSRDETVANGRLVVRREKKGRGGKTVTRVSGLEGGLDELARELKRALGSGASVEDSDVLLQGDQCQRAADWLRQRFGRDVTIGN